MFVVAGPKDMTFAQRKFQNFINAKNNVNTNERKHYRIYNRMSTTTIQYLKKIK